jgi:GNAT superfamily N-acetyltransferase
MKMSRRATPKRTFGGPKIANKKRVRVEAPIADAETPSSACEDYLSVFDVEPTPEEESRPKKRVRMADKSEELAQHCVSFPNSLKQYVKMLPNISQNDSEVYLLHHMQFNKYSAFRKKILEIKAYTDENLGFVQDEEEFLTKQYRMFVYVTNGRVVGCLIAEQIRRANPIVYTGTARNVDSVLIQTDECKKAILGVSRMFVDYNFRKQGIATKLLDAARSDLVSNYVCKKKHVAFTRTTNDGHEFAKKYMEQDLYLVY